MRKALIPLLALALCIFGLSKWTDGFRTFTVFSYTLRDAGTIPRNFPDIPMINQNGEVFHIKNDDKYKLVNFVYLDCPTVCHKVINRLDGIYKIMSPELIPSQLDLYTVSFDLTHDNITRMKSYRSIYGPDIHGWTFALPYQTSQYQLNQYLRKAGIWTFRVPGTGMINHSVYIFLISPENKVIKIFDPAREKNQTIVENIQSCLHGKNIASSY